LPNSIFDARRVDRPLRRAWQHWQRHNRSVAETVEKALRQDRLIFAFQPVVCAASGRIDYFECLLRMRDEERGLVTCGEFITAVEQLGLIGLIDRYVIGQVTEELAAHPAVKLGLNISGLTACDRDWLRLAIQLLRRHPDRAGRLVVEITETAALDNLAESARCVDALRDLGCRVALDDFGAGYTSLRHLQTLAVDTVKIDGGFVRSLPASRDSRVFLRHLVELAQGLGLHTVGECVETAEEAALLDAEGVGYLQGFYCGRPTIERCWLGEASDDGGACD
jgi:EAL domain-containing protein (putative c-di-GMP-specific phosphodiesterase class I)